MSRLERYLAMLLAASLIAGGWLLYQRQHWRQTFYNETVSLLLDDIQQGRRHLELALAADTPERRGEALGQASAALGSAVMVAYRLEQVAAPPARKGRPVHPWMQIGTYTNQLLHYTREVSPDMWDWELQQRITLLSGLEEAIRYGIDGRWSMGRTDWSVNEARLIKSWHGYLTSLMTEQDGFPPRFLMGDPPVAGEGMARLLPVAGQEGVWDLVTDLRWERTYAVWPRRLTSFLAVYPDTTTFVLNDLSSDQPPQDLLGEEGALLPVELVDKVAVLFDLYSGELPAHWDANRAALVRVPEGLNQTVTIRIRTGNPTPPELEVRLLQHSPDGARNVIVVPVSEASGGGAR